MDRRRLRDRVRRPSPARGRDRRPLRPKAPARHRARRVRSRLARRALRRFPGRPDRDSCADGRGGRLDHAGHALGDHDNLPARRARESRRDVGRSRRRRSRDRTLDVRHPAAFLVLATAALAGTFLIVPATRESRPPRLDPIGTLVSVVALAAIVFGTIEGPERGWSDPVTLASLLGGLAGVALFVVWELKRREPMLDPRNFLRRSFGAGSLSISVQFFALFGFLFL